MKRPIWDYSPEELREFHKKDRDDNLARADEFRLANERENDFIMREVTRISDLANPDAVVRKDIKKQAAREGMRRLRAARKRSI